MKNKVLNSNLYKEKFIEKANNRHNFKYNYSKVEYINSITKVEVICKEHGSFFVRPDAHVRKVGCPKCNGGIKYTESEFIQKAKEKHNNFYNYDKVNYINSSTKVIINCPEHGDFKISPANHLIGQKCSSCSGVKRKTTMDFIEESILIHSNKYNYNKVDYKNNRVKVIIECPEHGEFEQVPKEHIKGHGCKGCSNFSKGEEMIEKILKEERINFIREYRFDDCISINGIKLPFDFYVPDFNLLIEYDGRQHFEPVSKFGGEESFKTLKINDEIRNRWSFEKGIKLIRISYKESFEKLINILKNK
jgi:very-short-patch-repair endonuclease